MATPLRFALVHMGVAFSVGYAFTGDLRVGGALALVEPLCNTLAYYFHEKVWKRIESSQAPSLPPPLVRA